jgi:hypothetical protein
MLGLVAALASLSALHAEDATVGLIDTAFLEQPWPKQRLHDYEVDKYVVRWRQRASKQDGIYAGASFTAPARLDEVWALTTDFTDLGRMTPSVDRVEIIQESPTRQVVILSAKVLWKRLKLRFEIEQEPPRAVRFRLVNPRIGEYRGVCLLTPEGDRTAFELATWLKTPVPVSSGLILWAERVILLDGIREFLKTCETLPAQAPVT